MMRKKRILSLLMLLMTAVLSIWADDTLYLVIDEVDGTTATLKCGEPGTDNPYYSGFGWSNYDFRNSVTSITVDASCLNFTGGTLQGIFTHCITLTTINDFGNLNTANVTNMVGMFSSCTSLTSLDLNGLNTAKVDNMQDMFNKCSNLTSLDLSGWSTANVTIVEAMFSNCSSLTSLDLSGWNTANLTNTGGMFYKCSNLSSIYVGDGWNTDNVSYSNVMFKDCSQLPNFNSNVITKTNAHYGAGGYLTYKAGYSDDNTTAIRLREAVAAEGEGEIYDLSGRRVMGHPQKGIYVKSGKKFVIK